MLKNNLAPLISFLKLGRPLFLLGGFVFHALGILVALVEGALFSFPTAIVTQLVITSTQLMTHYSNEYFDLAADKANETISYWAGGSRILVERDLDPRAALAAGRILAIISFILIVFLTTSRPEAPFTFPLLFLALALAAQYSAPPLKLHWRGYGALAAALIVPTLTTFSGFYLQAAQFSRLPFLIVLPLALLQAASLISLDFPDRLGDTAVGKKTIVVRLGPMSAARLHQYVLISSVLSLPILYGLGLPGWVGIASGVLAPAGLWQNWQLRRAAIGAAVNWSLVGFTGIALLIGTALLQGLALITYLP